MQVPILLLMSGLQTAYCHAVSKKEEASIVYDLCPTSPLVPWLVAADTALALLSVYVEWSQSLNKVTVTVTIPGLRSATAAGSGRRRMPCQLGGARRAKRRECE